MFVVCFLMAEKGEKGKEKRTPSVRHISRICVMVVVP